MPVMTMYETDTLEKRNKTIRILLIAILMMIVNGVLDYFRNLSISAVLILFMIFIVSIVTWMVYKNQKRFIITIITIAINIFLVLISFAEGLKSGAYLYILPLLFALSFLMSDERLYVTEMWFYFILTAACFCTCIFFCDETSRWQIISPGLYKQMFICNGVSVILLCAAFAGIALYFEKQYRKALIEEKNKAEIQKQKIIEQNEHLREIAFTSSHVIRQPLANIISLTSMLGEEEIKDAHVKELISHLETSSGRLDEAVKEIINRTNEDFCGE